ncbi:thioredoxin family protein [Ureibacillus sp. FSL K6-8385]|uniref:Thioredoxin family protein n=1 Tax=Ureibacillus terrenus TaxID=118246 RepID=A0A540V1Z3_9BACL|nr:thioredoxin family protein [Ureibacillus terrenus]MED3661082.1 thioredoxin family protein [Ureibacillus terrenus]MED3763371.1 thioredoxin family protein [Ureibacillus terrenus]TQE90784.1 thioredoxin family protein [Ureibacillus terrenus]
MKKLGIIAAIVVILFAAVIILTNLSNKSKLENNPYGTTNLKQSTIDLLDDKNYQNIILPDDLRKKIKSGEPVVAYLFSPECPHCKNMTPRLMPIADEMGIHIDQLNILEYEKGWDEYDVEYTPTLIYFKDGKEVKREVGAIPDEKIREFLADVEK